MPDLATCGPFICDYPRPETCTAGDQWSCPRCGTTYRLTAPVPNRWWRNSYAPHGSWVLADRWCWHCPQPHDLSVAWWRRILHYAGWWP
jgi:hypothetical protein